MIEVRGWLHTFTTYNSPRQELWQKLWNLLCFYRCAFHSLWWKTRGRLGTNTNNKVDITLNTVTIIRSTPKLFFCLDTLESKSHIKKKTKIYNPLNYDFITKLANHQQAIEGIDFWNMKLEAPFVTPVTLKTKSPQATTVRITREVWSPQNSF